MAPTPAQRSGIKEPPSGSILETNKFMLDNEVECDVKFVCTTPEGRSETVGAHRYMLISRNAVFRAMLCGPLAENNTINVPDVNPDAFRKVLRYLYCEEFVLDDDLVYDVMYVAKKYLIFSLTERCLEYLITNLTPQNVCCSLNYAMFYDERELLKKSLRVVSVNTREVFASDFFLHVSGRTIGTILACGALNATEEEIFAASLAWAKGECGRLGLDSRTPGALRMALGANLYQLRLAAISEEAIARDVLGSGLLTQQEETHLMEYREDPGAGKPLPFQTRKRSWIEVGCVSCDFVQTTTQATVLAKTCHEHTIKVSEAVNLHQVVVLDRRPSTMVGIQITVSQYGTCLRRSSMPIPTLRGNTVYGKTIPISFPQTVPVEAGEFSVDIVYQFIGTYGTVTCCVPHNEAVVCNGVRCEISYKASCQIASLGLSVA